MQHIRILLIASSLLAVSSLQAGEPSLLPRYQALEKSPGVKLRRVFGAGELPLVFTRASGISADGKTAAYIDFTVVGEDKLPDTRLLIWDIPAGRFRKEILIPGSVTALALSADGTTALIGGTVGDAKKPDHVVSLWDITTGKRLHLLGKHKMQVGTVVFSSQKDQALSTCWGQVKTWNLAKGNEHKAIDWGENADIFTAVYLPDSTKILVVVNNAIRLVDPAEPDGKKAAKGLLDLNGHQDTIIGLAVSPDGKIAVSASRDETIMSWDLVKGKAMHVLKKDALPGRSWISLALGDDGKTVFSVWSDDQSETGAATVRLWDAATGKEVWSRPGNYRGTVPIRIKGQQALVGGGCNVLTQWELGKGAVERTWGGHKSAVSAVRTDAKGRIYSAGQDGYVHVWEKDELIRSIPAHSEPILATALNPKETQLFTVSADKTIKIWDLATDKLQRTLAGHTATVTAIAFSPDGKRAYTGSSDRTVKVWDLETGNVVATLAGHSEGVNAIALTADEAWLATGSDDASIRVWPIKHGKPDADREAITLEEHKKPVTCLAFSRDGKTLFSGSQDQTLMFWDWAKGKRTRTIAAHKNWITSLTVVDAGTLLTTSDDLTMCRWDIESGKETARVDFGVIGDCPRCLTMCGPNGILVGTSSWLLFELELTAGKTKEAKGSSE